MCKCSILLFLQKASIQRGIASDSVRCQTVDINFLYEESSRKYITDVVMMWQRLHGSIYFLLLVYLMRVRWQRELTRACFSNFFLSFFPKQFVFVVYSFTALFSSFFFGGQKRIKMEMMKNKIKKSRMQHNVSFISPQKTICSTRESAL